MYHFACKYIIILYITASVIFTIYVCPRVFSTSTYTVFYTNCLFLIAEHVQISMHIPSIWTYYIYSAYVYLIALLCVLTYCHWRLPSKFESYGQTPKQLLWGNFRVLFAIFSSSGVTWTFIVVAFLLTSLCTTLWLHYIFAVFNTIQPVFV